MESMNPKGTNANRKQITAQSTAPSVPSSSMMARSMTAITAPIMPLRPTNRRTWRIA